MVFRLSKNRKKKRKKERKEEKRKRENGSGKEYGNNVKIFPLKIRTRTVGRDRFIRARLYEYAVNFSLVFFSKLDV